jgi:hypothetical protein
MKKPESLLINDYKRNNDELFEMESDEEERSSELADDELKDPDEDKVNTPIRRKFKVGNKTLNATYKTAKNDRSKTIVTLSDPRETTEGQATCDECGSYEITRPLRNGNYETIQAINRSLEKQIHPVKKGSRREKVAGERRLLRRSEDRRRLTLRDRDFDDERQTKDPIDGKCGHISNDDRYTLCAMRELGTLAKIRGDRAWESEELQELFETHIF